MRSTTKYAGPWPLAPIAARPNVAAGFLRTLVLSRLGLALLVSQILAAGWWLVAVWLRSSERIPIWYDQQTTFTQLIRHVGDPYAIRIFVNPPWAAIPLAPFGLLPLPLSVLVQLCLYFALLTALVFKYGGGLKSVLIALTSFMAFDNALELNIEWVVGLGLLLPAALGAPFLLVKPQLALGAWFALRGPTLARTLISALLTLVLSLALWPRWPLQLVESLSYNWTRQVVNVAPLAHLPLALSLALGLGLAWYAHHRRDAAWGLLAWLFITPYMTLYSLLLHFTVLCARNWRLALLISALLWLIYGGFLALFWFIT